MIHYSKDKRFSFYILTFLLICAMMLSMTGCVSKGDLSSSSSEADSSGTAASSASEEASVSEAESSASDESGAVSEAAPEGSSDAALPTTYTICLDAGHGGNDWGARGNDVLEKNINLEIARKTQYYLESCGYQVVLTRSDDSVVDLKTRLQNAKKAKADALISIHQNSLDNDTKTNGMKVFCNETSHADNVTLASLVSKHLLKTTSAKDRGTDSNSDLYLLKTKKMPTCLVEDGFLTAEKEGKLLTTEEYQLKIAEGITQAIREFLPIDPEAAYAASIAVESRRAEEEAAAKTTPEPVKTTSGEPSPDEKVVYITIDDGPTTRTPKILDILDQYDAKATWLVTAQYMTGDSLSDMLKQIHDRGHVVGVHTYSHVYKNIYASVDAYMKDYNKMNDIIIDAIGEDSKIFRFPGGSNAGYNKSIRDELIAHVKAEGLVYYDWNAFTGDVDGLSKEQMIEKAVKESSYNNKTILLMHDVPDKESVVEALPSILAKLKKKGYEFRALDADVKPIQFAK